MIAAVSWVPKGVAKALPLAVDPPSNEEIQELIRSRGLDNLDDVEDVHTNASSENGESDDEETMELDAKAQIDEVAGALAAARALGVNVKTKGKEVDEVADELKELDMDHYDDEDDDVKIFGNGGIGSAYYANAEDDPYIINKDDDDDEDEIEDMTIKPSDLLILTARNEDDVSHLEVWVYEEAENDDESNMYVHHDIMLPAFPLCLAWLDCNLRGGEKGNFVAVGSMQPEIEIWDLDVLDEVEPTLVLGGNLPAAASVDKEEKKKKKKKKKHVKAVQFKEGSHTDAVLGLSWNNEYRNVLASASADHSVKIWDIVSEKCEHTLQRHSNKVQSVAWNPNEPTALLSGSFDRTLVLMDMRAPSNEGIRWNVSADVECLAWNPHVSHSFVVSLEDGVIQGFDIRSASTAGPNKGIFTIHAHEKAACAVAYSLVAPNLLATASTDKMVKLWDVTDDKPSCIASVNPKVGAVFAASFCKESPFLLAVGGSKGNLHIWNTLAESEVAQRFGRYATQRHFHPGSNSGLVTG